MTKKLMKGTKITNVHTLEGMYDNKALHVDIDEKNWEMYRMTLDVVFSMTNDFVFTLEKKHQYTYLTVDRDKTLELRQEEGW